MTQPLGITGLVAAPHTPFDRDGGLRLDVVEEQAALLVEGGVSGAFVCGTTGEGLSLTGAERRRVAEHWVRAAPDSLPVIVHVGHTSVAEARELAAHAEQAGARAVAALAPCFFKPRGVDELIDCCATIASGSPSLPFYYYHLPSLTGVSLPMAQFLQRARGRIPTLAGIKYTHNDLMDFRQCVTLAAQAGLDMFFGRDEILLAGLTAGARGAVGSTYNYAAPVYRRLIDAFHRGDTEQARRHQDDAVRLVEAIARYGEIPAAKAILAMMGVDCGPARPPLVNLDDAQKRALCSEICELQIFTRPLRAT